MFENDEDMELEIVTCIKNLPSRENCLFKWEFFQKFVYLKQVYHDTRQQNINSTAPIVSAIEILAVRDQDWNLLISVLCIRRVPKNYKQMNAIQAV